MRILTWLMEGTWEACVDALGDYPNADLTLMYVIDEGVTGTVRDLRAGLLGRGTWGGDRSAAIDDAARAAATALLDAARARLGDRPTRTIVRTGRPEREAVAACPGADLLILARDGDSSRLGPHSLGHHTRFVVDHAPCSVLLIWPDRPPALATIPPPPRH